MSVDTSPVTDARHPARPRLHFTPPDGWMNDPNGLIRLGDTYHLYYQHNPDAIVWGNIHWGHATSTDLLRWAHQPMALAPDHLGQIFTGSVVVDADDTAGFGAGALVAIFTHAGPLGQVQSLASSTDGGTTWTHFDANPVLQHPTGAPDFRDPKVVRFTDDHGVAVWVMALAVGCNVDFYRSEDLRSWEFASSFTPDPRDGVIAEVPDLFEVLDPDGNPVWTLMYSVIPPGYDHTTPRQVFWAAGSFDGVAFTPHAAGRALDDGPSFYAAMAWSSPGTEPICIGWMDETPSTAGKTELPWCGRQSVPRHLSYRRDEGELVICQVPMVGIRDQRAIDVGAGMREAVAPADGVAIITLSGPALGPADSVAITVEDHHGDLLATLTVTSETMTVHAPDHLDVVRPARGGDVELMIIIDVGSIEVFADGGRTAVSATTPPRPPRAVVVNNRGSSTLRVITGEPAPFA